MVMNHNKRHRIVPLFYLLIACFVLTVCTRKTARLIFDTALATCQESTVFLSSWWSNVGDESPIQSDPIGGYLFLYCVDGDGNACHGKPGVNGQPGSFVVNAFHSEAFAAARAGSNITIEEMQEHYRESHGRSLTLRGSFRRSR